MHPSRMAYVEEAEPEVSQPLHYQISHHKLCNGIHMISEVSPLSHIGNLQLMDLV